MLAGFSGHGFKFGAVIGEAIAEALAGARPAAAVTAWAAGRRLSAVAARPAASAISRPSQEHRMTKAPAIFCALDRPDLDGALALGRSLAGVVGGFKVGLEFVTANGPDGVRRIVRLGLPVFLDLKFHDIPNTVAGAMRGGARARRRHADPARRGRAGDAARRGRSGRAPASRARG